MVEKKLGVMDPRVLWMKFAATAPVPGHEAVLPPPPPIAGRRCIAATKRPGFPTAAS